MSRACTSPRARAGSLLAVAVLVCGMALPVMAEERGTDPKPRDQGSLVAGPGVGIAPRTGAGDRPRLALPHKTIEPVGNRFYRDELLPRLSVQLGGLVPASQIAAPGSDFANHLLYDSTNEAVERGVKRATRRAVRNYLLEVTDLDHALDGLRKTRHEAAPGPGGSGASPSRVRFNVGFHSAMPKVEMRYSVGESQIKVGLGAEGNVNVRYRSSWMSSTELAVGYDGDGAYYLAGSLTF